MSFDQIDHYVLVFTNNEHVAYVAWTSEVDGSSSTVNIPASTGSFTVTSHLGSSSTVNAANGYLLYSSFISS